MKKKRMIGNNLLHCTAKFCFVILLFFAGSAANAQATMLTVISNQNGAPPSMKFSEVKSVFMGEQQRWRSGTKISIALLKTNTNGGKNTLQKVYGMSSDELNKFWLALVFQGKAHAPNFFNSADELENFVAQNSGAIGISDQVNANNDVRIVTVEGKKSF